MHSLEKLTIPECQFEEGFPFLCFLFEESLVILLEEFCLRRILRQHDIRMRKVWSCF